MSRLKKFRQIFARFRSRPGLVPKVTPQRPVLLCTYGLAPGGSERQWVYLAKAFAKRRLPCAFVTYEPLHGPCAHYLPDLLESGISFCDASQFRPACTPQLLAIGERFGFLQEQVQSIGRLIEAFTRLHPSVVFAQLDEPNIFSGIAARLSGVPRCIMSFRSLNPTNFNYILRDWMLPAYRWLAEWEGVRFTANSIAGTESYAEWMGIPHSRIVYIPNAVGDFVYNPPSRQDIEAARKALGLASSDAVLLGVFRLTKEKKPASFLSVCHELLREFPSLKVLLVGDGPMKQQLSARARELGLDANVAFLGHRSDVKVLMRVATLLLHTSVLEGMSNVVMEAQASGLPVVAYDLPGVSAAVQKSKSAILCPVDDAASLVGACKKLLREPILCRKMGTSGRRFILSRFGDDAFCARYLDVALDQQL